MVKILQLDHPAESPSDNVVDRFNFMEMFPGYLSWVSMRTMTYLGVNTRLASLYELKPQDFVGKSIGFAQKDSPFDIFVRLFVSSDAELESKEIEVKVLGRSHWFNVSCQKMSDGDQLMILSIDITHSKDLECQLRTQQAQMLTAAKMSALGEMAAGVAHEINNPLAIIQLKAAELKQKARSQKLTPEVVTSIVSKIEATTLRISKIIKGMALFARDGEGSPAESVNLHDLINETLIFSADKFRRLQIELKRECASEQVIVECRSVQISQVLLNLLSNACDAIEMLPERWIEIAILDLESSVQILVTDSGHGLSKDVQEKIQQPFFTTKPIGKGTGLGLSVSRGIASAHGGRLTLDTTSENTRFVVELPKIQPKQAPKAA